MVNMWMVIIKLEWVWTGKIIHSKYFGSDYYSMKIRDNPDTSDFIAALTISMLLTPSPKIPTLAHISAVAVMLPT